VLLCTVAHVRPQGQVTIRTGLPVCPEHWKNTELRWLTIKLCGTWELKTVDPMVKSVRRVCDGLVRRKRIGPRAAAHAEDGDNTGEYRGGVGGGGAQRKARTLPWFIQVHSQAPQTWIGCYVLGGWSWASKRMSMAKAKDKGMMGELCAGRRPWGELLRGDHP
jgi:hypothetical protein